MADLDYGALFNPDDSIASSQAAALAQAMRQRRAAGMMLALSGDPAMTDVGQALTGEAGQINSQLASAAQHRAQQAIEQKRYQVESDRAEATRQHWQTMEDLQGQALGLKSGELVKVTDALGNTKLVPKYAPQRGGPGAASSVTTGPQTPAAPKGPANQGFEATEYRPGGFLRGAAGLSGGPPPAGPRPSQVTIPGEQPPAPLDPISAMVAGVKAGRIPPDLSGIPRLAKAQVVGRLAQDGWDLSAAQTEWNANKRLIETMNGQQQMSQRQSLEGVGHQLDVISNLYDQWQKLAPTSGFKIFNRAALGAAKQRGGDIGAVAQGLEAQIADLTSELSAVYSKGGTPTDHAMALAGENLSADWDDPTFRMALANIRRGVSIRKNALNSAQAVGVSGNRYAGGPAGGASSPGPVMSEQDQAAQAWATDPANANDPRAAAILERLRAKGH